MSHQVQPTHVIHPMVPAMPQTVGQVPMHQTPISTSLPQQQQASVPQPAQPPVVQQQQYQQQQQQPVAAPPQQQMPVTSPEMQAVYQQNAFQPTHQHIPSSVSVQNLSGQTGPTVGAAGFQHSVSIDETLQSYGGKKVVPENLKHILESSSNRGSQASTPQNDVKYDAHLQSLQQKLSSIPAARSSQNSTAPSSPQLIVASLEFPQECPPTNININKNKIQIDPGSVPGSGTTTSEILSPVIERDLNPFDTGCEKQLSELNSKLNRINSRTDTMELTAEQLAERKAEGNGCQVGVGGLNLLNVTASNKLPNTLDGSKSCRERKVSRFKVSVVNEPDKSMLVIPDSNDPERGSTASMPESESKKETDFTTVINTTFDSLKTTLVKSLPTGGAEEVPLEEVSKVKPHEVGNNNDIKHDPYIGTTVRSHHNHPNNNTLASNSTETQSTHINDTSHDDRQMKKSLSYVDLKKEIESLLPINQTDNNPRRMSTGRKQSKSFRQFPQIVVHPPESEINVTNSMPDIPASLVNAVHAAGVLNNVSNKNASCPDLTNENLFSQLADDGISEDSLENDDVFEEFQDHSENVSVCSDYDLKYQQDSLPSDLPPPNDNQLSKDLTQSAAAKQKYAGTIPRRKKTDETPSDVLKRNWKMKHSNSMHNLLKDAPKKKTNKPTYDNYYTVHGESNFSHHANHSHYKYNDYPHFSYYDYHHPSSFHNMRPRWHSSFGSLGHFHSHSFAPDYPLFAKDYRPAGFGRYGASCNTCNTPHQTEVLYKCCCGGVNCNAVVPIHEYLETYFTETEETFEEMLNRQKAELNALMEAHRKQQLEYMEKKKH